MGARGQFVFLIVGLWCVCFVSVAEARRVRTRSFLALDAGMLGMSLDQRYSVNPENADLASSISAFVRLRKGFSVARTFLWEPSLGLRVPWRSGADGNVKIFTLHGNADFAWQITNFIKLRGGPGVQWELIWATAETVSLANGNSTSDFFVPGGLSNSFTPTANLGLEFAFTDSVSLNLDTFVLNPISQSRRRINGAVTLGFKL